MGVLDHLHVVRYLDVALLERPEVKEAGEAVAVRRAYRGPFGAVEDALELCEEALLVLQPWFALVRHRRHYARARVEYLVDARDLDLLHIDTDQPRVRGSQHGP